MQSPLRQRRVGFYKEADKHRKKKKCGKEENRLPVKKVNGMRAASMRPG